MSGNGCLHTAFSRRAAEVPDRVAVSCCDCGDDNVTYGELDARSDDLAARLRGCGVGRGAMVGVCLDRSIDLVVAIIAVLKAGGVYVPVDADHPAERISFVLGDSGVALTVSATRVSGALDGWSGPVLWLDGDQGRDPAGPADRPAGAEADDPAYVIYTSGSTGTPKGVVVEHRAVVALLERTAELFEFDDLDVWTLFHSIGFDFSVWELWGALLSGGRLVIVGSGVARTPAEFHQLLRRERVTVLNQTPSAFRQLVAADLAAPTSQLSLRLVVFGGERLDVATLEPWISRHGDASPLLVNMYGITEVTVHATHRRITSADLARPTVSPIGEALPGMLVELRDEQGRPVPDGEAGEIHVGGTGIARGYLNRPELTADRFVTVDGARWYRSGDRATVVDGDLVYLGRTDRQLKIRGYRVEPGEVEARLLGHPGVGTAVVAAQDFGDGDVRLVAYVAPRPGGDPTAILATELAAVVDPLPSYLRPSAYHVVGEIPLTTQGKADLAALRSLTARFSVTVPGRGDGGAADTVKEIVEEVLQRDVDLDADLFDNGATSLAFVRIVAMVNDRFGSRLTGAELDEPTINCLATVVGATRRDGAQDGALQEVGG